MRKLTDLTVNDFPGVDPIKFQEWKVVAQKTRKNLIVSSCVFTVLVCFIGNFIPVHEITSAGTLIASRQAAIYEAMIFPSLMLMLCLVALKNVRLMKELGITYKMVIQSSITFK